jgi:isopropylmalate/homocitrate/citramalate synthase
MLKEALNKENINQTSPLRDFELKEYEIQGKKFAQRKPCFDYRIRISKKQLNERFDKIQRKILRGSMKEFKEKSKNLAKIFNTFSSEEIESLFDKNNPLAAVKLECLRKESPDTYYDFLEMLTSISAEVYSAMELFVMDRENLKDLIETMLEGDVSAINLNPEDEVEQKELDTVGLILLNDFFLSKNH